MTAGTAIAPGKGSPPVGLVVGAIVETFA